MEPVLQILHLEDEPLDTELAQELLKEAGLASEIHRVDTLQEFAQALERGGHALIISDYTMPGVDPMETLRLARQVRPDVPFIFLSGTIPEDRAIETLKLGASDYVWKQRMGRFVPSVRRALREAGEQARRRQAESALTRAQLQLQVHARDLEQTVARRTAELREANANLEAFAYTAAHDLRSPLRAINMCSSLVISDYAAKLDAEARSLLERITQAAERMGRLLNDLLEYSKISQMELKSERVDLQKAVREALSLLEADIREKQAEIAVVPPFPDVVGHPATVVLVLNNLVSNALKFVRPATQPRVRIWAEPGVGRVRLWVQDNGIGIPAQSLEKLFGAFERLGAGDAYPGTGLGLAIVKKGVERMGGRAGVESKEGEGSAFWVELPAANP